MAEEIGRNGLYSIGKLSKSMKVSVDTLRYYDKIGLLKPACISDETGYRYYTLSQASALARILEMKEYGFSLAEIGEWLANDEISAKDLYQNRYARLLLEERRLRQTIDKLAVRIKQQQEEDHMNKRILLVDDADFMRMMCKDIFTRNGHTVAGEARDGVQALELYKSLSPDLTVMDICMPNGDGILALQNIKEYNAGAKAVMLSAMGQGGVVTEALMAGAQDFVVKPFQPDRLLNAVSGAFEKEKIFDRAVLQTIHDCFPDVNVSSMLSQDEIDEIIEAASGGKNEKDIEALVKKLSYRLPANGLPLDHDVSAENEINMLTILNKISEGQDEIKSLINKLMDKK